MRADCPLVVYNMQDARRPKYGRKVESMMKVALRGSSVANPGGDRSSLAAIGEGHGSTNRLRQLRADGARDRHHISRPPAVMHRHLPTFGVVARIADRLAH